ncbi:Dipeptidyl-peptidase 5 [Coemansia guatemalensis]|uniref:Dipeptidyl-peptidase V n=1 Tax=Coemansia guatemalensis TaxID=2761395 RepID=A0A9W8I4M4_9FUNG|nr:Dipeptidyl-peptidase 5 [Coemansia guatemalensis]
MCFSSSNTSSRSFTPKDLVEAKCFGGTAVVSPDGTAVAYIQTQYSSETKMQSTQLLIQSLDSQYYCPVVITDYSQDARPSPPSVSVLDSDSNKDGVSRIMASQPMWLGNDILGFIAINSDTKESTLYSVYGSGNHWTEPRSLLTIPVPISNAQFSTVSRILTFIADIHDNAYSLEDTIDIDLKAQDRADSAQAYDELWVRYWDKFITPKRPQLHTIQLAVDSEGLLTSKGNVRSIIKNTITGERLDTATSFKFSPDGRKITFVAKKPGAEYAWKITTHVYIADADGSTVVPINYSDIGACSCPVFCPDGSKLAYLLRASASYESIRRQLMVYDMSSKNTINVAPEWDSAPRDILWADNATLLATYNNWGRNKLAKIDIATGAVTPITEEHSVISMQQIPNTDKLLISYDAIDMPTNLYTVSIDNGDIKQVSSLNPQLGTEVYLSVPKDIEFVGAKNATIHGFILLPPNFDPGEKYPLVYAIHGGPQHSLIDSWSVRRSLNIYAAAGFVVVGMDTHGSSGYGQEFVDSIQNDWGGKPYESLMLSLEQLLDKHPYIDRSRMVALGESYGGYMINWINGHTDMFKALVNHAGIFSTTSWYYSTEELWFPEADFGGTPFEQDGRKNYEKWSPERLVSKWKTPTLVSHGDKDYRVPINTTASQQQQHDDDSIDIDKIWNVMRNLKTGSAPSTDPVDPLVAALRQRVQSSPWVQQVTGGTRMNPFFSTFLPRDLQIRVKPKVDKERDRQMLSIDELDHYSKSTGKSNYLPLSARGVFSTITDLSLGRLRAELGWVRPDIVEHCARVLRLRVVAELHRAHIELFTHIRNAQGPLEIPEKGTTQGCKHGRLDIIRDEVNARLLRQDAQWEGSSPFVILPPPPSSDLLSTQSNGNEWQIPGILPSGGLQCIIELPYYPGPLDRKLSTSSESHAQLVWKALAKHGADSTANGSQMDEPLEYNILDQGNTWKAFVMSGRPEIHEEPTLSIRSLEQLYHSLPRITPTSLTIPEAAIRSGSRKRIKRKIARLDESIANKEEAAAEQPVPELCASVYIRYNYSVSRPGSYSSTAVDSSASKAVPLYHAQALFGTAASTTVIPWLLHTPMLSSRAEQGGDQDQLNREKCYIGIVSLPCTAGVATQLYRASKYAITV